MLNCIENQYLFHYKRRKVKSDRRTDSLNTISINEKAAQLKKQFSKGQ